MARTLDKLDKYEFGTTGGPVMILAYDRWQAKRFARMAFRRRPVYMIEGTRKTEVLFEGRKNWARLT
jgi:hypothetical protein